MPKNRSACYLLVEIWVCLNLEKEENGSIKGQDSAFYSLFIKIQKYFQSSRKEVGKLWLQASVMKVMPTTQMPEQKMQYPEVHP